ncbi:conjugal transfer protein TraQ [Elizabethkingia bruuniana]|uniref:DUF3872 domain-containing protein n=1 Tax=Elizabethkingia bruuniana TaxID=1756149 RepID=UPI00099979FB|nr:DUF3872 domain-containing protein [Elizabethkingia bruuniana]OPC66492.1 conjugal transfer protein TraQ [Elizabethkingia bruuniana]
MKRILNRNSFLWLFLLSITGCILLSSCNKDELDIQQNYPFEVEVMPIAGDIANGQTVEIRMTIERSGNFNDAKYFIRYFQYDGQGTLRYYSEPPYMPNDSYQLPATQFRLYYTSQSAVSQSFDVWITDNFGNEKKIGFQFNNKE